METEHPGPDDPQPENCPHCLNRGGNRAQCGVVEERDYDRPLSATGQPMPVNLQGVYREGSVVEVEVLVTTHHKGHFEFAACPLDATDPTSLPTPECFAAHKLVFVSDKLY